MDPRGADSDHAVRQARTIRIFVSYAQEDREFRLKLENHIRTLVNSRQIEPWSDSAITAGSSWNEKISKESGRADIILMLISDDFLSSEYVREHEIPFALKRRQFEGTPVIPI